MAAPADTETTAPVVLFDGDCVLCNGVVQWMLRRDRRRVFRYASLTSAFARAVPTGVADGETVVLLDSGRIYTRSAAAVRILSRLGLGWKVVALLVWMVPAFVRDAVYDFVARNRYRWFGRRERCVVPTDEMRDLFYQ